MNWLTNPGTAQAVSYLASVVVPAVAAFLYRRHWPLLLLGTLTLALSAANGFLTEWAATGNHFDWQQAVARAAVAFVVAAVAHAKVWDGTDVERRLLDLGAKPARRGRVAPGRHAGRVAPGGETGSGARPRA